MQKINPTFLEKAKKEFYKSEVQTPKQACVLLSCKPAHEKLESLCEREPVNYKRASEKLKEIERILHSHLVYKKHSKKIGYAIFLSHKYPLSFVSYYILKKGYSSLNDVHKYFKNLPHKETKELYRGFQHANSITAISHLAVLNVLIINLFIIYLIVKRGIILTFIFIIN